MPSGGSAKKALTRAATNKFSSNTIGMAATARYATAPATSISASICRQCRTDKAMAASAIGKLQVRFEASDASFASGVRRARASLRGLRASA